MNRRDFLLGLCVGSIVGSLETKVLKRTFPPHATEPTIRGHESMETYVPSRLHHLDEAGLVDLGAFVDGHFPTPAQSFKKALNGIAQDTGRPLRWITIK